MSAKALLDSAKTLFDEEKYEMAKNAAENALGVADDDAAVKRSLKLLVRKCNLHLEEAAGAAAADAGAPAAAAAAPAPAPAAAPAPAPPVKPQTSCRHEWFQTPTSVTFSFYVKARTDEQVSVHTDKRSIDVSIKLDNDKVFALSHEPLFAEIDPAKTQVLVKQPKVEVVMFKAIPNIHWSAIELQGDAAEQVTSAAPPAAALPQSQAQLTYPNSRGKDWSKWDTDEVKDPKPGHVSGEDGLNDLFRQIYANADDENRKAMIKSFTESGGTVLSTNWGDVGSRTVDGEPPKGMEKRTYEQ